MELLKCELCSAGTFSSGGKVTACKPCQAGYFCREGVAFPEPCSAGNFSGPGAAACQPCEAGSYTDATAQAKCTPCPPGYVQPLNGSKSCVRCEEAQYRNSSGGLSCSSCESLIPGSTTRYLGATSPGDCLCSPGSRITQAGRCTSCPSEGVVCAGWGASPNALKGYFLPPDQPLDAEYLVVLRCIDERACPGGGPGSCGKNMRRRLCAQCDENYVRQDGECKPCTNVEMSGILFPCIPLIGSPLVLIALYNFMKGDTRSWSSPSSGIPIVFSLVLMHYQTVALIHGLNLDFPEVLGDTFKAFEFTLAPSNVVRPECAGMASFQNALAVKLIMPLYVAFTFVLTYFFCRAFLQKWMPMDRDVVFSCLGAVFYTFFIGIAAVSFSLFKCYGQPDGSASLISSPDIVCGSDEWSGMLAAAIIALIVYCVGALVVFSYVLFYAPGRFQDPTFQKRWKFLVAKFRPSVWWWGVAVLVKGICLNLGGAFFTEGSAQLLWTQATLILYVGGIAFIQPWMHRLANVMDLLMNSCLVVVCTLMMGYASRDAGIEQQIEEASMVICFVPLVIGAGLLILLFLDQRSSGQQETQRKVEDWWGALQLLCANFAQLSRDQLTDLHASMSDMDFQAVSAVRQLFEAELYRNNQVSGQRGSRLIRSSITSVTNEEQINEKMSPAHVPQKDAADVRDSSKDASKYLVADVPQQEVKESLNSQSIIKVRTSRDEETQTEQALTTSHPQTVEAVTMVAVPAVLSSQTANSNGISQAAARDGKLCGKPVSQSILVTGASPRRTESPANGPNMKKLMALQNSLQVLVKQEEELMTRISTPRFECSSRVAM